MAEIDNGSPVMIQLEGHSMVGVGYNAADKRVYLHDTWGDYVASMTWGGSYSGMDQYAVTVLHLKDPGGGTGNGSPELSTWMLLACSGLAGVVLRRRRKA